MPEQKNCFVIIGYGKKTSYANGKARVLDLDETYTLLIKPVFDALNISCYRAIDKNLNGSIDKVMLQEIRNANIAIADISTLNANVMWELGVRHALKPHHTIMICEKEQMGSIPFDVNHFVVHSYVHSEEGIPYKEVDRFKKDLTTLVTGILKLDPIPTDSPVFTFLDELKIIMPVSTAGTEENSSESFASLMDKAEKAKDKNKFAEALIFLKDAKTFATENMTLRDNLPFIISRQALCTYKQKPEHIDRYKEAKKILSELQPEQCTDIEVLGLSGAINKKMYELSGDEDCIEEAIKFYEKGFQLKRDYYNGINTAFMLYKKASLMKPRGENWEDIKLKADYIKNEVLTIALDIESQADFIKSPNAIWVLLTIAEAYNYKRNTAEMEAYETKAGDLAIKIENEFAMPTYNAQKEKIKSIFEILN